MKTDELLEKSLLAHLKSYREINYDDPEMPKLYAIIARESKLLDEHRKIESDIRNQDARIQMETSRLDIERDKLNIERDKLKLEEEKLKTELDIERDKLNLEEKKLKLEEARFEKENKMSSNKITGYLIDVAKVAIPVLVYGSLTLIGYKLEYCDNGRTPSMVKDLLNKIK